MINDFGLFKKRKREGGGVRKAFNNFFAVTKTSVKSPNRRFKEMWLSNNSARD